MVERMLASDNSGRVGAPVYMAPEQVEGREPINCTDLFALGLVLYEMSAGRLPFPAGASLGRLLVGGSQSRASALAPLTNAARS
jgi:serine/threonine protein kinase